MLHEMNDIGRWLLLEAWDGARRAQLAPNFKSLGPEAPGLCAGTKPKVVL